MRRLMFISSYNTLNLKVLFLVMPKSILCVLFNVLNIRVSEFEMKNFFWMAKQNYMFVMSCRDRTSKFCLE